jgi:hypothetical protein
MASALIGRSGPTRAYCSTERPESFWRGLRTGRPANLPLRLIAWEGQVLENRDEWGRVVQGSGGGFCGINPDVRKNGCFVTFAVRNRGSGRRP